MRLDEILSAEEKIRSAINALPVDMEGPYTISPATVWVIRHFSGMDTIYNQLKDSLCATPITDSRMELGEYTIIAEPRLRGEFIGLSQRAEARLGDDIVAYVLTSKLKDLPKTQKYQGRMPV